MASKVLVELLQSLGRIPGLSFLDQYASRIIGVEHAKRDRVDRYHELRGRADEVRQRTGDLAGGGSGGDAGDGQTSRRGTPGRPTSASDRAALRGGPAGGNVARLRDGAGPPPARERLRRRRDTID